MFWKRRKKFIDLVNEIDFQLENEVLWGVKNLKKKSFCYCVHYGKEINWKEKSNVVVEKLREPFSEEKAIEHLESIEEKEVLVKPAERIDEEDIQLPIQEPEIEVSKTEEEEQPEQVEQIETEASEGEESPKDEEVETMEEELQAPAEEVDIPMPPPTPPIEERIRERFESLPEEKREGIIKGPTSRRSVLGGLFKKRVQEQRERSAPLDLLKMQSLQENLDMEFLFPKGALCDRNAEKDIEDEEHRKMLKEREKDTLEDKRLTVAYNLKDFPLAEPKLVNELCEAHKVFFDFLSKLQETHTPSDFKTAYHIQDRIAYLIDNQTLLYKSLTKQLIKYLNRINDKLKNYYNEITLKQDDLRKINAQIARFNEYDRKTHDRLNFAEQETHQLQLDAETYQNKIDAITEIEVEKENVIEIKKS